ncbi:hypothetical protein AMAG_04385 [Allomyces macrogynus ATCC 38327]|uniref:tripeptidyl-peptidase II n=1 Tax=Allomyces macrogynus (strain ATCC 38327) TaxID=578462 RepID=A0A0L0S8T7_ALLM3|nr:hypothetical protein AMAG_04385 [Allomyces macrogynus ATCC 38327]|eukprot:KNE58841.1 hypothetical protein AMAG_04385 [Allomyces macrogynus ATCC 38327]
MAHHKIDQFPVHGLLPKEETEAAAFLRKNPEYDGRNTIIAILDTGVDPGAPGLQTTTDGKPKIVDIVDCTGAGDVPMSAPVEPTPVQLDADAVPTLRGATGRRLLLSPDWTNPSGTYRVGIKRGYDLFPVPVLNRLKKERKAEFMTHHARLEAQLLAELATAPADAKRDLQARVDALKALADQYDDVGPVYDVVCWYDGTHFRVVVDTDESGDLRHQPTLASYRFEGQYHRFSAQDNLNFSVNVYDSGTVVSIATVSGSHGTHVAAIAAAHHAEEPALNGIAPGAQIVSLRIGDGRLMGMETGPALARSVLAMVQNKVDLVNISYGEAASVANTGRFIELLRDHAVRRHNVVVVSSAGNEGPALTTVGAPGGTTAGVISVGAHVGHNQMTAEYNLIDNRIPEREYTWSSRGPTYDGDWGVDIYAPGSAITSVPTYQLAGYQLMNGTSMSSPNACGNLALLISGWKAEVPDRAVNSFRLLKAVQNTGRPVETDPFKRPCLRIDKAFTHLIAHKDAVDQEVNFAVSIGEHKARGVYLRDAHETAVPYSNNVTITPEFPLPPVKHDWNAEYFMDLDVPAASPVPSPVTTRDAQNAAKLGMDLRLALVPSAPWVRAPAYAHMTSEARAFPVEVDTHLLTPGLHIAHVDAYDTTNKDKGVLFSVPITICKPQAPDAITSSIKFENVATSAGSIDRRYIAVPHGATFADISVRARSGPNDLVPAIFLVRTLQLAPQQRWSHESNGQTYMLRVGRTQTEAFETKRQRVLGGVTMELTLAQWWTAASNHLVDIDITFHGIEVHGTTALVQGDKIARLTVESHLRREEDVALTLNVAALRKFVRAQSAEISPLSNTRDVTPSTRQVHQLVLTFPVEVTEASQAVTPRLVGLTRVLYDAPYEALLLHVVDAFHRRLATHDMYPKEVKLAKGSYTVQVQIRHDNLAVLEELKNVTLALDTPAPKGNAVDLYPSFEAAVTGGTKVGKITLERGERRAVFAKVAQDIADAAAGDVLVGTVSVAEGGKTKIDGGYEALQIAVTNGKAAPASAAAAKPATAASLDEVVRDAKIAYLKTLKDDEDARVALLAELEAAHPTHLPLLLAKLDLAVAVGGAEAVIVTADQISAAIDRTELAAELTLKAQAKAQAAAAGEHEAEAAAAAALKAAERRKAALVTALLHKAQALLDLTAAARSQAGSDAAVDAADAEEEHEEVEETVEEVVEEETTEETSYELVAPPTPMLAAANIVIHADHGAGAHRAEFEAAVAELRTWQPDPPKDSYAHLQVTAAHLAGGAVARPGAALKAVNAFLDSVPRTPANADAVKKAYALRRALLVQLGWTVYADAEHKWSWVRFPEPGQNPF